jgi:hypothetical protein
MKAPSVREGSKENGTQVTGNRIYKGCLVRQRILAARLLSKGRSQTLQALLQEMVENLFTGLWLANPRLRLGADPQKFPGVDHAQRRGQTFYYIPIPWGVKLSMNLSSPCVAFFSETGLQVKLCGGKF